MEEELNNIIKSSDMEKMKQVFPTAQSLVDYNHAHPEKPLLEKIAEAGNSQFLKDVFKTYFSLDSEHIKALEYQFLEAENFEGKKVNYHYFAPSLPADYTKRVSDAFEVKQVSATENKLSEVKAMEMLQIIKDERKKLNVYRNELTFNQQAEIQNKEHSLPPLYVRNVSEVNIDAKKDNIALLPEINLEKDILPQAYEKMDFPDDFSWTPKSLKNIQRDFRFISENEEAKLQYVEFAKSNKPLILESKLSSTECNTSNYAACCGDKSIIYNDENYKNIKSPDVTYHELVHYADRRVNNHVFSDTTVCKTAIMMMDASGNETISGKQCQHIHSCYKDGSMFIEGLAYVSQTQLSIFANDKDNLAKNLFMINNLYCEARSNQNTEVLSIIEQWQPKPEVQEMLQNYTFGCQGFYGEEKINTDREKTLLLWKDVTLDLIKLRKDVNRVKLEQGAQNIEQQKENADLLHTPAAVSALKAYETNQQYKNPNERHFLFLKYMEQQIIEAEKNNGANEENKLAFSLRYLKHFMKSNGIDDEFMSDKTTDTISANLQQFHCGMQALKAHDDYGKHSESEHQQILSDTLKNLDTVIKNKNFNADYYYQRAYLKQYLKEKDIDDRSMYDLTPLGTAQQMKALTIMAASGCDYFQAVLATHTKSSIEEVKALQSTTQKMFEKRSTQEEKYDLLKQFSEKSADSPQYQIALLTGVKMLSEQNNVPFLFNEKTLVRDASNIISDARDYVHDCRYLYTPEKERRLSSDALTSLQTSRISGEKLDKILHMSYDEADKVCGEFYQRFSDKDNVFGTFVYGEDAVRAFIAIHKVYQKKTGKELPEELKLSAIDGYLHGDSITKLYDKFDKDLKYPVVENKTKFSWGNPFEVSDWGKKTAAVDSVAAQSTNATRFDEKVSAVTLNNMKGRMCSR